MGAAVLVVPILQAFAILGCFAIYVGILPGTWKGSMHPEIAQRPSWYGESGGYFTLGDRSTLCNPHIYKEPALAFIPPYLQDQNSGDIETKQQHVFSHPQGLHN